MLLVPEVGIGQDPRQLADLRLDLRIDVSIENGNPRSGFRDDVYELAPPLPGDVDEHGAAEPDGQVDADETQRARQRDDDPIAGNDACRSQPGGRPRPRIAQLGDGQRRSGLGRREALRRDAAEGTATRAGRRRSPKCGQELPRVAVERVERRARGGRGRRRVEGDRVLVDHPEREVLDPDVHELA